MATKQIQITKPKPKAPVPLDLRTPSGRVLKF